MKRIEVYYMGRQFKEGIQVFEDLKKYRDGQDKACDLYIDRCKNFWKIRLKKIGMEVCSN